MKILSVYDRPCHKGKTVTMLIQALGGARNKGAERERLDLSAQVICMDKSNCSYL